MSDQTILEEVLRQNPRTPGELVEQLKARGLTHERAIAALQSERERRKPILEELLSLQRKEELGEADEKRIKEIEAQTKHRLPE